MTWWNVDTGGGVDLECDGCGRLLAGTAPGTADWTAVWQAARVLGWRGAPVASGPHRCPECAPAPVQSSAHRHMIME